MINDFIPFRFSTQGLPPAQRLPRWYELLDQYTARRRSQLGDAPCHVDMLYWASARGCDEPGPYAGPCCIQRVVLTTGMTAQRAPEHLADGNNDIVLRIHEIGRASVSQLGREIDVEPGGGCFLSNADASTVVQPERSRVYCIGVPAALIRASVPGLEDRLVRPLSQRAGVVRLLTTYLRSLEDEPVLEASELRRTVASHIVDLCVLAIGATHDAAEIAKRRGLRAARLRAIKVDIAQNLRDGDVSAAALAQRQRVTPRYIHKLFESEGATLSRFVRNQRLAWVYRMLTHPRHADIAISTIAYDAGFCDLSTFNREFRRHFGATPSDVRTAERDGRL